MRVRDSTLPIGRVRHFHDKYVLYVLLMATAGMPSFLLQIETQFSNVQIGISRKQNSNSNNKNICHSNHFSVTRNGHSNQISLTTITWMLKKKTNLRMKTRFVKIGIMCIVILNIFYNIYINKISGETFPLKKKNIHYFVNML